MSGFCSELAVAGNIIDDEEMIGYITTGLDNSYNALVDIVDNTPGISVTNVTNQINSFDMPNSPRRPRQRHYTVHLIGQP
jgi:hypothetical protein